MCDLSVLAGSRCDYRATKSIPNSTETVWDRTWAGPIATSRTFLSSNAASSALLYLVTISRIRITARLNVLSPRYCFPIETCSIYRFILSNFCFNQQLLRTFENNIMITITTNCISRHIYNFCYQFSVSCLFFFILYKISINVNTYNDELCMNVIIYMYNDDIC